MQFPIGRLTVVVPLNILPILASRGFLLEAAETILGYFGFDGTAFGDPQKKNKK